MEPTKFKKKPVEIEAIQFVDNDSASRIIDWILGWGGTASWWCDDEVLNEVGHCPDPSDVDLHDISIETLEGVMVASLGDWIIKGVQGEFYPCKPDIFEQTYDRVDS